jgi:hypothetical protein
MATLEFGRAIRSHQDKGDAGHPRLHDSGKQVGNRGTGGTDHRDRHTGGPGQAKGKKAGGTLVKDGNRLNHTGFGKGKCQRCGSRTRSNHGIPHAKLGKL